MKRTCHTYLQYKYSIYLFMKYIFSSQVVHLFRLAFSNNVAMFVHKHVLLHENIFSTVRGATSITMENTVTLLWKGRILV